MYNFMRDIRPFVAVITNLYDEISLDNREIENSFSQDQKNQIENSNVRLQKK